MTTAIVTAIMFASAKASEVGLKAYAPTTTNEVTNANISSASSLASTSAERER